jgi:hypothetical protein
LILPNSLGTKTELEIRNRLILRQKDFVEQKLLAEAILRSKKYPSVCSQPEATVDETTNGPVFQFPMQGSRSRLLEYADFLLRSHAHATLCKTRWTGFLHMTVI